MDVVRAWGQALRQGDAAALVRHKAVERDVVWIPALLRQGVAVGVKDLERKARQRHHLPGGGVALHHLQPGCQGVVVRDVLQLGAVRHLLGADGPVSNVREARRHRGLDLVNGVAAGVVGKGAVHTGRAGARAKPK